MNLPLSPAEAFLGAVVLVVVAKTIAWLLQLRTRNAGIVDAIWAWSLGGLAVWFAVTGAGDATVRAVTGLLGGLWGLRLGWHLWLRNWGAAEDWRYAGFRARWGDKADRNMWFFFQFQNIFTLILACSAFLVPASLGVQVPAAAIAVAGVVWAVAVLGESVADRQLEAFRCDPENRGKVCDQGLWGWSRHPNYFFETLHWLAYVPLAWGSGWLPATLLAPLVMAFLLLKMSGLPILEAGLVQRKPGYAEYMKRTSAFIPLPPRR
jgi:steroid 5-alpha reductase family enzyme